MFNGIKNILHTLSSKYFVEITYVEMESGLSIVDGRAKGEVPVEKETFLLQCGKDGSNVEFVTDPVYATCFDYVLGALIAKQLKKIIETDTPNLQVSLVTIADAGFINQITNK